MNMSDPAMNNASTNNQAGNNQAMSNPTMTTTAAANSAMNNQAANNQAANIPAMAYLTIQIPATGNPATTSSTAVVSGSRLRLTMLPPSGSTPARMPGATLPAPTSIFGSNDLECVPHIQATMIGVTAAYPRLSRLLKSGKFADAEVKCGSATFKVHKAILCQRSEWFDKALTGELKVFFIANSCRLQKLRRKLTPRLSPGKQEAVEAKVTISNFEPKQVEWMLKWLYSGGTFFYRSS